MTTATMIRLPSPCPRPHLSAARSGAARRLSGPPIDEPAARYASTLRGLGGRAVTETEARVGPRDQPHGPERRRRRRFRAAPDDRSGRPDGRRQDKDRPPPGGAAQPAVLRFGQRDRGRGRRDDRGDFPQPRRSACSATASAASSPGCWTQPPHILATGGGAFMDPATRAVITRRGVSVWLRADLDVLLARVSRRSNRPLLQQRRSARGACRADRAAPPDLCRGRYRRSTAATARPNRRRRASLRRWRLPARIAAARCGERAMTEIGRARPLRVELGERSYDILSAPD